ncbi:MAG: hypothetical protein K1000chlam3_01680 [Chlamydiae bacterium]|nr:hypothetical protein [Chlamydiota bacterium]
MTANVYFFPIKVHFKPLPEFAISPQWFSKKISWLLDGKKVSPDGASTAITPVRFTALVSSYLFSPNVLIPLQILEVLAFASSSSVSGIDKTINVIFSAAILGIIVKYTQDGTLRKFSDDLYSFAEEGKSTANRLKNGNFKKVTFHEPFQITDSPQQMSCIRSIISYINSIIKAIFQFFFFCKEKAPSSD